MEEQRECTGDQCTNRWGRAGVRLCIVLSLRFAALHESVCMKSGLSADALKTEVCTAPAHTRQSLTH